MAPGKDTGPTEKPPGNIVDRANLRIGLIISWLIPIIALILVYELIMRYVFNRPTIWAHEISQFIFGITFMLGAGFTLLKQGHVSMDIFHSRFSRKARARIDLATALFAFLYLGVLVWKSAYMALDSCKYKETLAGSFLRPPIYPIKVLFFLGCLLFLLQALSKFGKDMKKAKPGTRPVPKKKEGE